MSEHDIYHQHIVMIEGSYYQVTTWTKITKINMDYIDDNYQTNQTNQKDRESK